MRKLRLIQEKQLDGTVQHLSDEPCSMGPCCAVTGIEQMIPFKCEFLDAVVPPETEVLSWHCSKDG